MKLVKSLLMASVGLTILGSQASAADYFVQPQSPGPVSNTPLAAISLQATAPDDESVPSAEQSTDTEPVLITPATGTGAATNDATTPADAAKSTKKTVPSAGAKWIRARSSEEVTSSTDDTTAVTASTETTTAGATLSESTAATLTAASETTTTTETTTATTTTTTTPPTTTSTTTAPTSSTSTTSTTTSLSGPTPVVTASQTYKSFGALLSTGKVTGGDRIFLLGGYHGPMVIAGLRFASTVTIAAMPGQVAHVDSINIRNSARVSISGLKVWPSSGSNGLLSEVRVYSDASDIVLSDLDVRAVPDSTNYRNWTITDWNNYQRSGFVVDGQRQTIARNRVTGIYNGIFALGPNAVVEENIVDGFAGDAYRALGDNSVVRRNKAQNCHQTNGTHTDGFQSFSRSATGQLGAGVVSNVLIESNKFFEYVGTRSPINCKLQGISLFDGMYDGFVIRNNLISSTAYHGITIGGGLNSRITNNTVIHAQGLAGKFPWIRVSNHKNGTPSKNVTVANNLLTSLKTWNDPALGIVETNNVTVTNAGAEFNSIAKQDFTLRSGATGIDKGAATLAPPLDIAKTARPKGKAPDAGAYESF